MHKKNIISVYRSHTCNELRKEHVGGGVKLSGWVHNIRDLGGVVFFELRDHFGITQLVIGPDPKLQKLAADVRKEFVVSVEGQVAFRGEDKFNLELETGEIEVIVDKLEILAAPEQLPFSVFPETQLSEELRLKYRFLDLRKSKLHQNIELRSKIIASIRNRMWALGFNEFQTPILTSSSPEGARDFLVPSRLHPGKFYALPQAPQIFKQLLMISGFDRYFQIAPCFRDEDARADRSPGEFYQLDIEMSFVTQEEVFATVEALLANLFEDYSNGKRVSKTPFPRISYDQAMLEYGTDKPDLRIPLKIVDLSEFFVGSSFRHFADKPVRAIAVSGIAGESRSFFDNLEAFAKEEGAEGLAWVTVGENNVLKGPIAKFLSAELTRLILEKLQVGKDSAIFLYSHASKIKVCKILGSLRVHLGQILGLVDQDRFDLCWIVDFPMYEKDESSGNIMFSHNPFSMPQGGLEALNERDPLEIKAYQYDIVCNGVELSSGAIRNHQPKTLYRAFEIAGYSQEEVDLKFGGLINALKCGAPPHGGIAPGIDRIVMLLAQEPNIREIIAFPMNQKAQDLMMGAPSQVNPLQLRELHLKLDSK